MEIFAQITKVDEARREVWGRAAQEIPDRSGEIMDYETSKPHFEAWSQEVAKSTEGKSIGNLRSMHGSVAAGKVISLSFDDAQKAVDVGVKVVDDNEWQKVLEGVHTGFSIGGRYERKWPDGGFIRYTAAPSEISLVDRPCIPSATFFHIQKADGQTVRQPFKSQPETFTMNSTSSENAVEKLAEMLNKGLITPERLITLAKREAPNPHLAKLAKGLDEVATLAALLQNLSWLQQACEWEKQSEGDDSPVPASILAAIRALADTFISMAGEETKEMLAELMPAALTQSLKVAGLAKDAPEDLAHIQSAHDHLVQCGAVCGCDTATGPKAIPDDTGNDGINAPYLTPAKAEPVEFNKAGGLYAVIEKQNAALQALGERLRKVEEQPMPAKGVLRAIAKGEDLNDAPAEEAITATPGAHNPEAAQLLIKRQFELRHQQR